MESAAGELFALLLVIYLIDCFRWVARGAVLLRQVPLLGAWVAEPWPLGSQFRRVLALGLPVPPFGSLYAAEPLVLRPGPAGVRLVPAGTPPATLPSGAERFVPWEEAGALRVEGLELRHRADVLHVFGSRRGARATAELLAAWTAEKPGRRPRRVAEALEARLDVEAVRARLAPWRRWRWPVLLVNSTLLLAVLGGLGLLSFAERPPPGGVLLAFALGAWLAAIVTNVVAARQVLPAPWRPTRSQWLVSLLSPLSLMRGADLVEGELVGDLEPAPLAAAVLPAQAARELLERWRRALAHPLQPADPSPASAEATSDDTWLRDVQRRGLEALIASLPDTRAPAGAGLHCPRCLTEYTGAVTTCASCPGVSLSR